MTLGMQEVSISEHYDVVLICPYLIYKDSPFALAESAGQLLTQVTLDGHLVQL